MASSMPRTRSTATCFLIFRDTDVHFSSRDQAGGFEAFRPDSSEPNSKEFKILSTADVVAIASNLSARISKCALPARLVSDLC